MTSLLEPQESFPKSYWIEYARDLVDENEELRILLEQALTWSALITQTHVGRFWIKYVKDVLKDKDEFTPTPEPESVESDYAGYGYWDAVIGKKGE